MIAFLKGHIEEKHPDRVLIDVNGVGYRVEISTQTFEQLESAGSELKILIYHHITENDQRLFGFFTSAEKALFEKLITVKGVGPKLGLTILSGLPASNLISAIVNQDTATLSRVPGIGKKTAERICLELKEKLKELDTSGNGSATVPKTGVMEEAIQALEALGFRTKEAEQAAMKAIKEVGGEDSSAVIRKALSMLNK
ncbi:MAG TPA: Holliday junction branch migration protein RuvA [Balneolaceae bacterium]|nr:Holliday junction branch migration protein RuvA [Balneolaceae bacterium]|tara:strand:- start:52954 stop:53547 length:594 start_codon:yes stop_codon:yes gene_type:complete